MTEIGGEAQGYAASDPHLATKKKNHFSISQSVQNILFNFFFN